MSLLRIKPKGYRYLPLTVFISTSSVLFPWLPALAASPTPGTVIENQATGSYTDDADGSTQNVLSDKVTVTVAEVAGITAANNGVSGTVSPTKQVYFNFKIVNAGNDPTQFFIPAAPSVATINGTAIPTANIGQLQVIEYNNVTTTTAISSNNLVNTSTGSATGSLSGIPNGGSVPAGGYVVVRVPITIPSTATNGQTVSVTLGNTAGQPANSNTPYILGANGTGSNDLYTQDNADGTSGETAGPPINGDTTNRRQEASSTQTATIVAVNISGTVWHDKNKSANNTFTNIFTTGETGTNAVFGTTTTPINAILVNVTTGKVIASTQVNSNGSYSFTNICASTDVKIILSTTPGTVDAMPPAAGVPTGWVATSPTDSGSFNSGITNSLNKDFGIIQRSKLVLIKRITGIKRATDATMQTTNPYDSTSLNSVVDNSATADDNSSMNWPTGYLKGAVTAGKIAPGDEIEYTVYFLNNQGADAKSVKICDPIRGSQTYVAGSMKLRLGNSSSDTSLTDAVDTSDRAQSYTAGNAPSDCNASNTTATGTDNGGIAIGLTGGATTNQPALTGIPGATGVATPTSSYGLFRFTTKVNP
jgi:hypothetical protein